MRVRSLLSDTVAESAFQRALDSDMRAARLSAAFRAYYRLRPLMPIALRQFLQRTRNVEAPIDWYFPAGLVEDLAAAAPVPLRVIHPWPEGRSYALVLTHDVDTIAGVRNVGRLADLEEELGFRSCWNFVPYKYSLDPGMLEDLRARGFEIGVHGYNHDGRLFASRRVFRRRAPAIDAALQRFQATGFRAPMVHRNLQWLQELNIQYDCSCFDVDPFQAMPGGVGSIWPLIVGKFVELPYTLPQDHTLLVVLGERSNEIWRRKLEFLRRFHGMALMLTHPDYLVAGKDLSLYREFLLHVRGLGDHWHALPSEVASWWRMRDASRVVLQGGKGFGIEGPAQHRGRVADLQIQAGGFRISETDEDYAQKRELV